MFYKKMGFYLDGIWLWRISGGYSQEVLEVLYIVEPINETMC